MSIYNSLTKKKLVEYPIEIRLKAYNKAIELSKKNLMITEIWKTLREEGLDIKYETLLTWIRGIKKPQRKLNTIKKFDKKLPYLVGLIFGDSCFYKVIRKGSYKQGRITFASKDKELTEKFACLSAKTLGKETPYKIWLQEGKFYISEFCSKQIVEFLSEPLSELKKIIEISPINFLRGIFDAEGCISQKCQNKRLYPRIFLTNSNSELINYVKNLLEKFGIKSTIQGNTKAGKIKTICNKNTATRKTCYNLCIENIEGVRKFKSLINFSIKRKQERLETLINLINKYGNQITLEKWNEIKLKL